MWPFENRQLFKATEHSKYELRSYWICYVAVEIMQHYSDQTKNSKERR